MPAQPLLRRQLWRVVAGIAAIASSLPFAVAGSAWAQATHAVRYRATIDSVAPDSLNLITREGQLLTIAVSSDTVILAIVPMKLGDIKPGAYIGSAGMPQPDGTQRALEVHVFPENLRGTDEGHGAYRPQAEQHHDKRHRQRSDRHARPHVHADLPGRRKDHRRAIRHAGGRLRAGLAGPAGAGRARERYGDRGERRQPVGNATWSARTAWCRLCDTLLLTVARSAGSA